MPDTIVTDDDSQFSTRATCLRCVQPMTMQDRRRCPFCRRWLHRSCWPLHQKHAHTKDDRAPFGGRRFTGGRHFTGWRTR